MKHDKKITGGRVEILLTRRINGTTFSCLIQPSRTKVNESILFADGKIRGVISGRGQIRFNQSDADTIYDFGIVPLPPYIKRKDEPLDRERYQTVFADHEGSCAAPTAGLHFTRGMLEKIEAMGVTILKITLHVGPGTFRPVTVEDVTRHRLEAERADVPDDVYARLTAIKSRGGRVIAVGSTATRALETAAVKGGGFSGETSLLITPGFRFRMVDALVTNFHLPRSSLLLLVSAFAGREKLLAAYDEAVGKKYRFYSYGDAMFIY